MPSFRKYTRFDPGSFRNPPEWWMPTTFHCSLNIGDPEEPGSVSVRYWILLLSTNTTTLWCSATCFGPPDGCWIILTRVLTLGSMLANSSTPHLFVDSVWIPTIVQSSSFEVWKSFEGRSSTLSTGQSSPLNIFWKLNSAIDFSASVSFGRTWLFVKSTPADIKNPVPEHPSDRAILQTDFDTFAPSSKKVIGNRVLSIPIIFSRVSSFSGAFHLRLLMSGPLTPVKPPTFASCMRGLSGNSSKTLSTKWASLFWFTANSIMLC